MCAHYSWLLCCAMPCHAMPWSELLEMYRSQVTAKNHNNNNTHAQRIVPSSLCFLKNFHAILFCFIYENVYCVFGLKSYLADNIVYKQNARLNIDFENERRNNRWNSQTNKRMIYNKTGMQIKRSRFFVVVVTISRWMHSCDREVAGDYNFSKIISTIATIVNTNIKPFGCKSQIEINVYRIYWFLVFFCSCIYCVLLFQC